METQTKETKWDDCTNEQKIERLREEFRVVSSAFSYANQTISTLQSAVNQLKNHYHAGDRVVIDIHSVNNQGLGLVCGQSTGLSRKNPLD